MNKDKNIIVYRGLVIILLFLTVAIISCNYKSINLLAAKNEVSRKIKQQQVLINNRIHIITALGVAHNLIKLTNKAELLKVTENIPRFLINPDYSINTDLQLRYSNLHKSLITYSKNTASNNKDKILYELNVVRNNFEKIIKENTQKQQLNQQYLNEINKDIRYLLIGTALIIFLLLICFYYFVYLTKHDKKIELKQFLDQNNFISLFRKYLEDNVVVIEHSCQRVHYHNGLVSKQLIQQKNILNNLQENYKMLNVTLNEMGEIYNNINSNRSGSKIPFKTYAKAVELTESIQKQINVLVQDNSVVEGQLAKNKQYIKNIFQANQKMSFNIRQKIKSKDNEVVC